MQPFWLGYRLRSLSARTSKDVSQRVLTGFADALITATGLEAIEDEFPARLALQLLWDFAQIDGPTMC